MELVILPVGLMATNCYVVACSRTRAALIIDPGDEAPLILGALQEKALTASMIVLTHGHFDHTGAVQEVKTATGAPVGAHVDAVALLAHPLPLFPGLPAPAPIQVDRALQTGEVLPLGDLSVHVLATPGHAPGGISLHIPTERVVFTGDALFREGVGRTDLPGSSGSVLARAILTELYTLPEETVVYPGHGPKTTIGWEKRFNPFVRPRP